MCELTRIFDIVNLYRSDFKSKNVAFARREKGEWMKWSASDYVHQVDSFSVALLKMGLKKGDTIGSISGNRPEWNILDMGAAQVGVVHVPIYPTLSLAEQNYILTHAEVKYLFISDYAIYKRLAASLKELPHLNGVFLFDNHPAEQTWGDVIKKGTASLAEFANDLAQVKRSILPDDLFTIVYTSGTTGTPKGVMLSHKNMLSNALGTGVKLKSGPRGLGINHVALSFLPLCHVYERSVNYNFQSNGLTIYYSENLGAIVRDIKDVRPHIFNTVPRLLEKVHEKVLEVGKDLTGFKKWLFDTAVDSTQQFELGSRMNPLERLKFLILDKLIYSQWREALGGRIVYMVAGGSALQVKIHNFFWMAGMRVYEGYGLSETSPVIYVNDPLHDENVMIGTVGPVLDNGTESMIAEDGEILARGPGIMMGYYKDEKRTREVIDEDGWFHTGDIGHLENGRFLRITDRKKEIFKLKSGKYVAPQAVENMLKGSSYIEQAFVFGANEKFASAIISPSFDTLEKWSCSQQISFADRQALLDSKEILSLMRKEVHQVNRQLGQNEQVKRFRLVADTWGQTTGELSQTLKLKRKVLEDRYRIIITDIYGGGA